MNCFEYYNPVEILVDHKCKTPGCKNTIVLDGNMKNQRDVCNAREAGYIEYEGLLGRVETGCMNTPAFKSRYVKLCGR